MCFLGYGASRCFRAARGVLRHLGFLPEGAASGVGTASVLLRWRMNTKTLLPELHPNDFLLHLLQTSSPISWPGADSQWRLQGLGIWATCPFFFSLLGPTSPAERAFTIVAHRVKSAESSCFRRGRRRGNLAFFARTWRCEHSSASPSSVVPSALVV